MISRNWTKLDAVVDKDGIHATRIYDLPEGQIMHLKLSAGAGLKPHKTPVNVAFYILEGEATVEIGDERVAYAKDTIIESPRDIPHAIYNETDSDVRLLVIKMPKP